jgi:hypothetical protein
MMTSQMPGSPLKGCWKWLLVAACLALAVIFYRGVQNSILVRVPFHRLRFAPTATTPAVALGDTSGDASDNSPIDPPGLAYFKTLHEQGVGFDLLIHYPYLQVSDDQTAEAYDRAIERFVRSMADSFESSVDPEALNPTSLTADYRILFNQDGLVSLYYQLTTVSVGSAHPGNSSMGFNFSSGLGRELHLSDLFQPGSGYLQVLSAFCTGKLKADRRLVFEKGVQPTLENFHKWNITPDGLLITFDPYQVAPYSDGYIQITVPYSIVSSILDSRGPLAPFASK